MCKLFTFSLEDNSWSIYILHNCFHFIWTNKILLESLPPSNHEGRGHMGAVFMPVNQSWVAQANLQKLFISMSAESAHYAVYIWRSEVLLLFPVDTVGHRFDWKCSLQPLNVDGWDKTEVPHMRTMRVKYWVVFWNSNVTTRGWLSFPSSYATMINELKQESYDPFGMSTNYSDGWRFTDKLMAYLRLSLENKGEWKDCCQDNITAC